MTKKNKTTSNPLIAENRKARHDYHIETQLEAGLILEGWEVKSIREGRAQLKESYVVFIKNEPYLVGAHISPLLSASTHIHPDPLRTRKLLLNLKEMNKLRGAVERQGYTIIPLNLHWSKNHVKLQIAIAKGKKQYDKREALKERDWQREKQRLLRR